MHGLFASVSINSITGKSLYGIPLVVHQFFVCKVEVFRCFKCQYSYLSFIYFFDSDQKREWPEIIHCFILRCAYVKEIFKMVVLIGTKQSCISKRMKTTDNILQILIRLNLKNVLTCRNYRNVKNIRTAIIRYFHWKAFKILSFCFCDKQVANITRNVNLCSMENCVHYRSSTMWFVYVTISVKLAEHEWGWYFWWAQQVQSNTNLWDVLYNINGLVWFNKHRLIYL